MRKFSFVFLFFTLFVSTPAHAYESPAFVYTDRPYTYDEYVSCRSQVTDLLMSATRQQVCDPHFVERTFEKSSCTSALVHYLSPRIERVVLRYHPDLCENQAGSNPSRTTSADASPYLLPPYPEGTQPSEVSDERRSTGRTVSRTC